MILRRLIMILLSAITLAVTAALGVSAAQTGGAAGSSCDGGAVGLSSAEQRILELHNQVRADNGLQPLCVNPILTEAARAHSQDMIDRGYFSHTSPDGETYPARMGRFGYASDTVGENIGGGSDSLGEPDAVFFENWMNSSEHSSAILNGSFREIGIGASTGTYNGYNNFTMYTVDFGSGQGEGEPAASEPPLTNETPVETI